MTLIPRILALTTATPPYRMSQEQARECARQVFSERLRDFDRMAPIFTNAGIDSRNSSVPLDWYLQPRGWKERNDIYLSVALDVATEATQRALDDAGLARSDIDAIVSVSSTGVATPSLDALLIERMGLRRDVQRLPIFGLGCAGGVLGLSRAASWSQAMPGRTILVVVVELCALSFRHGDLSKANVVATALFGDGAAAALIRAEPDAACRTAKGPGVRAWGEHLWPESLDVMGWRVEDDGLGVVFSQSIPSLVRNRFGDVTHSFLAEHGLAMADLAGVVCHPGGAKVLEALAEVLAPCTAGLDDAEAVLRDHGNMSAPTVLFVLERRLARGARGPHLMTALGPGFTAALALLDL